MAREDEPTNPGGPIDQTPLDAFMARVDRRLASIHKIAAETFDEIVALRPRVNEVERRIDAILARQLLHEEELERVKAHLSRGPHNPTPPRRPEGT